ncbi:MAG TPA: hypothetical protein VG165_02265 [Solirubrobacteraceae bacterium]|nr:hypothetical protein [Solirubrobacteraceae bacterium]
MFVTDVTNNVVWLCLPAFGLALALAVEVVRWDATRCDACFRARPVCVTRLGPAGFALTLSRSAPIEGAAATLADAHAGGAADVPAKASPATASDALTRMPDAWRLRPRPGGLPARDCCELRVMFSMRTRSVARA